MPQEQPTVPDRTQRATERAHEEVSYEPIAPQDEWAQEPLELPRRPRRRLLTPLPLTLTAILLIACGFIGGVLVEKGQSSSGTGAAAGGLASRFAALRGGAASTTGARGGGSAASLFGGSGAGRPTAGQVAYLDGSTLYVTNSEGNTVKVTTSAATTVTKTVSAAVKGIHPGETVTITGAAGSGGAISAESISVGAGGSGLAALFGAGRSSSTSSGSTGSSSGGPALFGGG